MEFILEIFCLVICIVEPNNSFSVPYIRIETLNKCLSHDTVEEIVDALVC